MTSFYYFNLNPLEFWHFLVPIRAAFVINLKLTEIFSTKFRYEKKNEKDSDHRTKCSKMMPSCKWPIACFQSEALGAKVHV